MNRIGLRPMHCQLRWPACSTASAEKAVSVGLGDCGTKDRQLSSKPTVDNRIQGNRHIPFDDTHLFVGADLRGRMSVSPSTTATPTLWVNTTLPPSASTSSAKPFGTSLPLNNTICRSIQFVRWPRARRTRPLPGRKRSLQEPKLYSS